MNAPGTPKPRGKHGCCADKACTESSCMELPEGKTCGHCVHERRCCTMFGHTPTDTYCDWFPRRFRERIKPLPPGVVPGQPVNEQGGYYAADGTFMNADGTRSIFDDVDE